MDKHSAWYSPPGSRADGLFGDVAPVSGRALQRFTLPHNTRRNLLGKARRVLDTGDLDQPDKTQQRLPMRSGDVFAARLGALEAERI